MSRALRDAQPIADCLVLIGGLGLFVSLFLTWSHQLPPATLIPLAGSPAIRGLERDPTAWQVYAVADVLLALLALALAAVALRGQSWRSRVTALVGVGLALAFIAHADSVAPTNGVLVINPNNPPEYLPHTATPGAGETVALVALAIGAAGLLLALAFDLSSRRVRHLRR